MYVCVVCVCVCVCVGGGVGGVYVCMVRVGVKLMSISKSFVMIKVVLLSLIWL